jgi:hypothetical protein
MVSFLSRLMRPRLTWLGHIDHRGWLDAMMPGGHTWGMPKSSDLTAVDVHTDDVGDYNVTEPGWYAVDDADKVVLGPFTSLAECERAIGDHKRMLES